MTVAVTISQYKWQAKVLPVQSFLEQFQRFGCKNGAAPEGGNTALTYILYRGSLLATIVLYVFN